MCAFYNIWHSTPIPRISQIEFLTSLPSLIYYRLYSNIQTQWNGARLQAWTINNFEQFVRQNVLNNLWLCKNAKFILFFPFMSFTTHNIANSLWLYTLQISITFPHFAFIHIFLIDLYFFFFSCQRFMNVLHKPQTRIKCSNSQRKLFIALNDEIYKIFIDLPENIAQIVAMTTENSTVIAPVSLNTITGTNTIIPMANRLHVPEGIMYIMSKSLWYILFETETKMELSKFIS